MVSFVFLLFFCCFCYCFSLLGPFVFPGFSHARDFRMWGCWCPLHQKHMNIIFVGEVFVPRNGNGMTNMGGYEVATEVRKGIKVVACW